MFVIEDERHAECIGTFPHRGDALAELDRLAAVPWEEAPNRAPCTFWSGCGRTYELVEYDTYETPWRELSRSAVLDVSADGVRWHDAG